MALPEDETQFEIVSGAPAVSGVPANNAERETFEIVPMEAEARKPPPQQPTPDRSGVRVGATRFQQARAPAAPSEKELSWEETARGFGRTIVPSTIEAGRATLQALNPANLDETYAGLKQLGVGAVSKGQRALGISQNKSEAAEDERALNAFIEGYKNTYGSMAGFKRALAEDPASVLLDLSTFLTGGAGALGKAGLASEKAVRIAQRAGTAIDPLQTALKVAKAPVVGVKVPFTQKRIPGAAQMSTLAFGLTTGRSPELIQQAARTAMEGTPEQRDAFLKFSSKNADDMEIVDVAANALQKAKKAQRDAYEKSMAASNARAPSVDFNPVLSAIDNELNSYQTVTSTGKKLPKNKGAVELLEEIGQEALEYATGPVGSVERSIFSADALKQRIGELMNTYKNNPQAYRAGVAAYNAVKTAIGKSDPEYMRIMREYEDAQEIINDIRMGLGVGRASPETVLSRLMPKKKPSTRKMLIEDLAKFDDRIPHMIAGASLRETVPGGLQALLSGVTGFAVHPVAFAGQLAASSPKVVGRGAYAAGRLGAAGRAITQPGVVLPAYYAGRAREEVVNQAAASPEQEEVFNKMLGIESSNRQFDAKGNTILGPEVQTEFGRHRAVGIGQVMPYTGPEAAEAAGVEWNEERLYNDAEYNKTLARAYFDKQVQEFGSVVTAAAAYNAGPERVRQAIRKAEETGQSFIEFLPQETKNYLQKIFGESGGEFRIERKSGGRVDNVERLVSQLMLRTKQAKRETTKATEPLLDQPDESIVKALDVAQQAI
jgi:hypothetical protein